MPPPSRLDTVYATDEDVVKIAGADFQVIASRWFKFAEGTDGAFDGADPWTLASASNDFEAQGVVANMAIQLTGPKAKFKGSGDVLAVESVSGTSVTLRRAGEALGAGKPPVTGATTGVEFLVVTLRNQLEDVAFQLNEQFGVDPALPYYTPGDIYDRRILRKLTVYEVVRRQYENMNRASKGDFADKVTAYAQAYDAALAAATLRWGPRGTSQPSSTRFSTRLER